MKGHVFEKNGCPSSDVLRDFGLGLISDEQFEQIATHLEQCSICEDSISSIDFRLEFPGEIHDDSFEDEPDYLSARESIARIPERNVETIPEQIAGYEVVECLGRGGMGVVYKVWDSALKRHVVVKLLRSARTASETAVEQFKKELQAVGNLNHSAIVQAHHGGFLDDGQPYLVMEYLEGETLYELVKRTGPLDEKRACGILRDVTSGVRAMHENGLIHRDVKPANVMILSDGSAKVLDLGLAQKAPGENVAEPGSIRGSLRYMSPEQGLGREIEEKTDVYGLGATLFFALTGQSSLDVDSSASKSSMLVAVQEKERRLVGSLVKTSGRLGDTIDRSQSVIPADRPTIEDFEKALGEKSRLGIYLIRILSIVVVVFTAWSVWNEGNVSRLMGIRNENLRGLFTDDFWDGTYSRWTGNDITGWKGRWNAEDKQFHIFTEETVEMGCLYASLIEGEGNYEKFANGTYTFKLSLDNLNTVAGGLFRWNKKDHDGYFVSVCVSQDGEKCIALLKAENWAFELLERSKFVFKRNEPVLVRVECYGSDISITAWKEHTDIPSSPQIRLTDSSYSSGTIALIVASNKFSTAGPIGARFDDVYFEVPSEQ